jgi:hypothetical protein
MSNATLMRIGHCSDGHLYLETRFVDGSFPEVYDLDCEYLHDPMLADTFAPLPIPPVIVEPLPPSTKGRNPAFFEAAGIMLARLRRRSAI